MGLRVYFGLHLLKGCQFSFFGGKAPAALKFSGPIFFEHGTWRSCQRAVDKFGHLLLRFLVGV